MFGAASVMAITGWLCSFQSYLIKQFIFLMFLTGTDIPLGFIWAELGEEFLLNGKLDI